MPKDKNQVEKTGRKRIKTKEGRSYVMTYLVGEEPGMAELEGAGKGKD